MSLIGWPTHWIVWVGLGTEFLYICAYLVLVLAFYQNGFLTFSA